MMNSTDLKNSTMLNLVDPLLYWVATRVYSNPVGDQHSDEGDEISIHSAIRNPPTPITPPSTIFITMAPAQGRRVGASNYGAEETKHLFDILERILPIGPDEWQQVADEHFQTYKSPKREIDSIRRKYSTLYRKQIPTGDPLMPDDVRQAKRIKHKIGDKAMMGDAEEMFDLKRGFNPFAKENEGSVDNNQQDPDPIDNRNDPAPVVAESPVDNAPVKKRAVAGDAAGLTADDDLVTPLKSAPPLRSISSVSNSTSAYKRAYNNRTSSADFLEAFHLSLIQQQKAREEDRLERREDRKELLTAITAFAQAAATAFTTPTRTRTNALPTRSARKRKAEDDSH